MDLLRPRLICAVLLSFGLAQSTAASLCGSSFYSEKEPTYERALECIFQFKERVIWSLRVRIQPSFSSESEILLAQLLSGEYIVRYVTLQTPLHRIFADVDAREHLVGRLASIETTSKRRVVSSTDAGTLVTGFLSASSDYIEGQRPRHQTPSRKATMVNLNGATYSFHYDAPESQINIILYGQRESLDNNSVLSPQSSLSSWLRHFEDRVSRLIRLRSGEEPPTNRR